MSTGIFMDWWEDYRECSDRELVGIYRRMNRRHTTHVTDEPILHTERIRAVDVGQTIHHDRKCVTCGHRYTPKALHQKFCSTDCKKSHNRAKERAQSDTAIAERIARMSRKSDAA